MVELKVGLRVRIGSEIGRICKKQGSDFVAKMDGGRLIGVDKRSPVTIITEGASSTTDASGTRVSTEGRLESRDASSEEVVVETAKPRRKKAGPKKAKAKRSAPKRKAAAKRKAAPKRKAASRRKR